MDNDYKKQVIATASSLRTESQFIKLINSASFAEEQTRIDIFDVIEKFKKVQNLNIVVFPSSFAFRVGKSSRNVIPGYVMGFKGEIKDQSQFVELVKKFKKTSIKLSKNEFASTVLLYFLLYKPNIVSYGENTTLTAESATISQVQNQIRSILADRDTLHIQIGTQKYEVDEFKKIAGVPKADAAFYFKNKPVIFISLKNGGRPGNFQQYGGWPGDWGIKNRSDVSRYKDLENFVTRVENIFKGLGLKKDSSGSYDFNNLKKGTNFAEYLDDPILAAKVIYGKDYGDTNFGINNVQIVLDGDIIFVPSNGYFKLEGSFKTSINPKIDPNFKPFKVDKNDIYTPVMLLAKSESQGLNQAGFKNVRAYVFPNNKVAKTYYDKTLRIEEILKSKTKKDIEQLKKEIVK